MDLPCTHWQNYIRQKWNSLDPELKKYFTSLPEIDDLFHFGLAQTTQEDLDFLLSVSRDYPVQKDPEQAARCRERGNASFKARDYTTAALQYSQGVCFATQSSEQLSLCYANRSAALYHLQRYQESLDDIGRALKHGYPSHLQHKLQDRRTQCLNYLPAEQSGKPCPPKPGSWEQKGPDRPNVKPPEKSINHGIDPIFCISPGVAVHFSPEKGRHLVATERIAAGEVILKDAPYSCVLIPGMQELRGKESRKNPEREGLFGTEDRNCHRCLGETLSPVPCEGCSYSRYCSSGCRYEAWEEHHRWECPVGADLRAMGVMSQLALRVALKAGLKGVQTAREPTGDRGPTPITKNSPVCLSNDSEPSNSSSFHSNVVDPSDLYYGDSYLSIYHLLHHLSCHSPSLRFLCAVTVATLYLRLSKSGPPPVSWDPRGSIVANSLSEGLQDEEERSGWSLELRLLGSAVLRHMLQLRCNGQAVSKLQDTDVTESVVQSNQEICIATAIFPTLSVLNHSCCPNTSLVFSTGASAAPCKLKCSGSDLSVDSDDGVTGSSAATGTCGVTVTVRAAKAIAHGQEILHCYGPHSSRMVMCERRRLLQEQYYFLCECEACSLQEQEGSEGSLQGAGDRPDCSGLQCGKCKGPLKKCIGSGFICSQSSCSQRISYAEVGHRLQEIRGYLEKAVELMETDKPDEALRLLQRTVSLSGLILTETHPLQGELADAMARAYASMGDWRSAASQLEQSVVAIGFQYGENSIELGRQLFKLAQLHFNGGAPGPAMSVIPRVRKLLSLHCGPDCPELQELQAMEDCIQG